MEQWHITVGILILAFAPGLFWLAYFYSKDRLEPEPLHSVRNCFLIGMFVVIPAILFEKLTDFSFIFTLVVGAPIIEEYFKFVAVRYTIYESAEFDEPMDGIVYAAATALGFASVENALYLFREYYSVEGTLAGTSLLRAFVSVPGHAIFSIMWGYALGLAKFSSPTKRKELVYSGLFLAIALHSVFNLLSFIGILWVIAMLIMVPLMWSAVHQRIERALQISQYADYPEFNFSTPKSGIVRNVRKGDPWYENRVLVVVLMFLVCFPIGLYGLWKNTKFSTPVKITYIALWIFVTGMIAYQTYDHKHHEERKSPMKVEIKSMFKYHRR
jgi:RsiW-degrading membrane proteinase PrsW (M82 family)